MPQNLHIKREPLSPPRDVPCAGPSQLRPPSAGHVPGGRLSASPHHLPHSKSTSTSPVGGGGGGGGAAAPAVIVGQLGGGGVAVVAADYDGAGGPSAAKRARVMGATDSWAS